MFEQDYIMRQIHEIIRVLLNLVMGKNGGETEEHRLLNEEQQQMLHRLCGMVDAGEVDAAENLLYERFPAYGLNMALLFYRHLNEKSDEFLEEHGFSRREIVTGIRDITRQAGLGEIADALEPDV